jgi:anaerobic magnesium-protoporphyrin IX monomethyl ester cyclase
LVWEQGQHKLSDPRNILLIHPPYGDVTYPYHSLSYVAATLKNAGYAVQVVDLNALWFRSLFQNEVVSGWRGELEVEFSKLDAQIRWGPDERQKAMELIKCIASCSRIDAEEAVDVFQSKRFYDYESYRRARQSVRAFEQVLSYLYRPYDFYNAFAVPPYIANGRHLAEQVKASARWTDDFERLLRGVCRADGYLLCGVSAPFAANVMGSLSVLAAARRLWPKAVTVLGGTAATDLYKNRANEEALAPLSEFCDYLYCGEAEVGVEQLALWCEEKAPRPRQVVDLRLGHQIACSQYIALSTRSPGKFAPYDWKKSGPDYSWIDWSLYLSPTRQVNYAPGRGCFWNKCAFCDYGLNDGGPTAPSRTMEPTVVVEHLRGLLADGISCVYFAADAIPPKFLHELASRLIAEQVNINWSAEFFLTKGFTTEFVAMLERSGLTTASFGLESGSSAVLERMGKGSNRVEEVLEPALKAFEATHIGLQPKYFFGFPGETDADRQKTVDFVLQNRAAFCVLTQANVFDLTAGSAVGKNPEQFAIKNLRRKPGDDIGGGWEYDNAPNPADFRRFNQQIAYPRGVFERPWAGGIDTLHTKLYVTRFGRDVFHHLAKREENPPRVPIRIRSRFNLDEVVEANHFAQLLRNERLKQTVRALAGKEFGEMASEEDMVAGDADEYLLQVK